MRRVVVTGMGIACPLGLGVEHVWRRLIASESSVLRGSARNSPILRSKVAKASQYARSICSGVPDMAAGSETPQCPVIGCPGQYGHCSFAALSQTVKTKSITGAPGTANSSHDLLRNPSVEIAADVICQRASERTSPVGWLPAL